MQQNGDNSKSSMGELEDSNNHEDLSQSRKTPKTFQNINSQDRQSNFQNF
jgi:hypothetical protein